MKLPTMLLCAGAVLAATRSSAAAPVAALRAADRYDEFREKLRQPIAINAYDEVSKLLKTYQAEAVTYVDSLCAQMATGNSDALEKEFAVLRRCWQEAFKSKFVELMYVYHSDLALDSQRRKERIELVGRYGQILGRFTQNQNGAKEGPVYELIGNEFEALSEQFEKNGDFYYVAQSSAGGAMCFDDTLRGNEADMRRACALWGRAVKFFDKIELNHGYYQQCKQRWETLVRGGFGPQPDDGAPGPDAGGPAAGPQPAVATAEPIVATTRFELEEDIGDFVRPSYFNDEIYQVWPEVYLEKKGSTRPFQALEQGPNLVRVDASKIGVDVDRDGTVDKTVGITGNFTTVEIELAGAGAKRKWAFVFKTGVQEDVFQGLKTNLAPDDNQIRLLVANAGSVVAQIGDVPVRVFDDNMDGVYGSPPRTYAYAGLSEGVYQPEMDSIVIGDSKRALPWSQYQLIDGTWYELAPEQDGLVLKATPTNLQSGTLRLEYKGPPPTWVVMQGTSRFEQCYFDLLAEGKKAVSVPAGTYELFCGEVRQGKKQQTAKALMFPGTNTQKWVVKAGAETVVKLGAPFGFDFSYEAGEHALTVKGKSVTIVGSGFERYERAWNCAPRPEVSWRKAGSKKGGKGDKMDIVLDLLEQAEDGSYKYNMGDTWHPLDTLVEFKNADKVEVQLVEKKNKLFGSIESTWQ